MKLTKNFTKAEFDSKDGALMPSAVLHNIQKIANNLQVLRDYLSASITVTSGYRSPQHNAKIGGAKFSQHLFGTAADIKVAGFTPKQVADAIEKLIAQGDMLQGGIGVYSSWVHYDIRRTRVRW